MSVPPAVAGGSMMNMRYRNGFEFWWLTHPLPQVARIRIQQRFSKFARLS